MIYSDEGDLVDPGQRLGLDVDTERWVVLDIDAEVTEAILAARKDMTETRNRQSALPRNDYLSSLSAWD